MTTAVNDASQTAYMPANQQPQTQLPPQVIPPHMEQEQPKQAARAEKVKVFELFQAMSHGKMPTNAQIMDLLNNLLESPSIVSRKHLMSSDGQQLLHDFQALLRVLQQALMKKNKDELFQSLVYHIQAAPTSMDKEHLKQLNMSDTFNKQGAKQEAKRGGNAVLTIGRLILLNGEFRNLLNELVAIAQDVFGEAASHAADTIQTTGESLSSKMQTAGESLSSKVRDAGDKAGQSQPDKILDQMAQGSSFDYDKTAAMQEPLSDYGNTREKLSSEGNMTQQDRSSNFGQQSWQEHGTTEGMSKKMNEHANNVQSLAKEKWSEQSNKAQEYAQNKFPPEKRQDVIQRLKSVLHQIQQHPEYQQATDTLITLVSTWSGRLSEASTTTKDAVANAAGVGRENNGGAMDWTVISQEAKTVLEDWAQGKSLNSIIGCLQNIATDVKNDESLRDYHDQVKSYLSRLLKEPGYVDNEQSTEDGRTLLQRGREVTKGQYQGHWNQLAKETQRWTQHVANDPVAKEIRSCFEKIHRDLWFDADGNVAFKPNLLNDMRQTLLPAALEQIKVIPIPRIEYSDPTVDVILENIILAGDALLPNIVEMKMDAYSCFSPKPTVGDIHRGPTRVTPKDQQTVYLKFGETQAVIDNVVFCYRMRTFPRMSDRGVASLHTGGKGINVALQIVSDSSNANHAFTVRRCKCHIDDLKVKIHNSKHNLLYKTMHPMVVSIVRRQVAKAIEKKITEMLEQGDQRLTKYLYQNRPVKTPVIQQRSTTSTSDSTRLTTTTTTTMQQRPGIFSSLVTMMNRNFKSSVNKRARHTYSPSSGTNTANVNLEGHPSTYQQVTV